ncbi:NAD(P)-dependent dehydrogenase (short-subunit alcohol dehydrogenase family) [Lewinella aquimaris]|uniref:NAD(P)-dependent dehydrogenase (Short-subunit alcohol dehydrogenase family) n=1 Tax=Neolewinella aquimaris TaxID=1835722 RepID=A0A840E1L4_9BACT|nr:SDR family oxidoreductase [Neolewinella aquimaris]MBB4077652.1 NAD(P)-dependent dehydrogenase (short-subunit alcohol dehydrogenase family) [Neolewinella aquimaris]
MTKTIIITGATGGFGRASAARFAAAGYFLGLFDVDEVGLREMEANYGPERCFIRRLDVTDADECRVALEAFAEKTGGRLDVLLNNAGIIGVGDFAELPLAAEHRIIDVNLKGVMNMAYYAHPLLKTTPGSRLINLGSASALHGNPEMVAYSLSKRAVNSFTESLDIAWKKDGIRVCDINPMYARTALITANRHLLRKLPESGIKLTPDDVARAIYASLESKRVHHYVGRDTKVFAFANGFLPFAVRRFFLKKVIGY